MVGIFEKASQSLKAFSSPKNISSEPIIEEYLDDPLDFSQDIQPTTFTVVQRAIKFYHVVVFYGFGMISVHTNILRRYQ